METTLTRVDILYHLCTGNLNFDMQLLLCGEGVDDRPRQDPALVQHLSDISIITADK